MRKLLVGGTFDQSGGKPSNAVKKLADALNWPVINGGKLLDLAQISFSNLDALIWMPNVDNTFDKILPTIKQKNQKLMLIQSKRVEGDNYTDNDIIGRLLQSHANLCIKVTVAPNSLHSFKVLDPLGNCWANTNNIDELAAAINKRTFQISMMRRIRSVQVGEKQEFEIEPEYIKIIQTYGERFTHFVNAINPNRLLGNASTRCARGFPGIRQNASLYVTRRNVDKQTLSDKDFVEIQSFEDEVRYYGEAKPSVDTPIQIRLFNYYPNVKYMLHGHVYVKNGIMTDIKIPCGFLDEFDEIRRLVSDRAASNFIMNLRGHGCLIMANSLDYFANQELIGRPFPEE